MHVQAISEVSTHQQPKPYSMRSTEYEVAGKRTALASFTDCLKSQIQDIKPPAITREAEVQAASSIWGFFLPQWVQLKPELRQRTRADESRSDL